MRTLQTILAVVLILGFTILGVSNIVATQRGIQLRDVELKSTNAELIKLQTHYDDLLLQLDEAAGDKERIKQLEQEKQQLDQDRQRLERELSAKREAQRIAKEKTQKAASLSTPAYAAEGGKDQWLAAAGIAPGDRTYASYIINKESTWRHTAWNSAGSGAYGLCQSLPASKMASAGSDYMTNPVTQLKWCDSYAKSRYGSWASAYTFWRNNSWW